MLFNILLLIVILALLNNLNIAFINSVIFTVNNHGITLYNLIVLALMVYLIGFLPRPFKEIVSVLLFLWVLSLLGILVIGGLTNILVVAVIIVLLFNLIK